ncbi:MAG: prephenate dehydratase [Gemmatimonadota bacterium]|nr:prephenate dehydratase [Gemmatimonadota bacterium]
MSTARLRVTVIVVWEPAWTFITVENRMTKAGQPATRRVVAFQGEPGAFSEEALRARFEGRAPIRPLPQRSLEAMAAAVEGGEADLGLLPIENSIAGTVLQAYDVLDSSGLHAVGETFHRIHHMLLGAPGADVAGLRQVRSHPVALAQCSRWLSSHPGVEAVAIYDTAGAARQVAEGDDRSVAAIAARGAAGRYGLDVLVEDLQDRPDNVTRFYFLSKSPEPLPTASEGGSKSVITFEVAHRPGALVEVLNRFARHGVNLTKLESRPLPEPWTYRFFLEAESDDEDTVVDEALEAAASATRSLRLIGRVPIHARRSAAGGGDRGGRA